ncbi:MAG: chromosome partitioning protein ParB [Fusobacteria bacterium]|nr:chromosome partitioning protein ParB [Fusobacteriota bacterium]
MSKLNIIDNVLEQRIKKVSQNNDYSITKGLSKFIQKYGDITHINKTLISRINFEDKTFINRLYTDTALLCDKDLCELKESIKTIGLINNVYLIEKEGVYIIVSGLRRLLSIRLLIEEGIDIKFADRAIILDSSTPLDVLESISLDENTQRKNLTILEQSYKFNQEAKKQGKSIDDILTQFKISKKQFYRIKNALDYPFELKNILESVGPRKAELIHRIIKIEHNTKPIQEVVDGCKFLNESELTLKLIQSGRSSKEKIIYKTNSKHNKITIEILTKENPEIIQLYEKFKSDLEKLI